MEAEVTPQGAQRRRTCESEEDERESEEDEGDELVLALAGAARAEDRFDLGGAQRAVVESDFVDEAERWRPSQKASPTNTRTIKMRTARARSRFTSGAGFAPTSPLSDVFTEAAAAAANRSALARSPSARSKPNG